MLAKQLQGAAKSAVPQYIEDVFSTWLYTGNGSTQTITNGIDLSGKGGLLWIKGRSIAADNRIFDTQRGASKILTSNNTGAEFTDAAVLSSFNANGFSLGGGGSATNASGSTYASWTFRKQPKFFDIVTWTGNGGTSGRTITHNLGSVPGCIIVKAYLGSAEEWFVYHRSLGNTGTLQYFCILNTTAAQDTGGFGMEKASNWTATQFALASGTSAINSNGQTYVAYLFAHDAGGFGAAGTDNVISCGSYTGNGGSQDITLGYEPQWLLIKKTSTTDINSYWVINDNMRGALTANGNVLGLQPNTANAEDALGGVTTGPIATATGFRYNSSTLGAYNTSGQTYIYIAIRRGPMKTPTSGTSVFSATAATGSTGTLRTINFPSDMSLSRGYQTGDSFSTRDRLRGFVDTSTGATPKLSTTSTAAETSTAPSLYQVWNTSFRDGDYSNAAAFIWYNFRRAPGFFDVVCYTGTGSNRTVTHNLGVAPELIIFKARNTGTDNWFVYAAPLGATKGLYLNATNAAITSSGVVNDTAPTSSVFTTSTAAFTNINTTTYVAYLFATATGVSKVGGYTGNGSNQTINCGFTAGARFIMIKRTDSTGDWYVWDTARGIVSGNDPHLSLNTTAAEVTTNDTIDPDNSGFIVNQVAATNVNESPAVTWVSRTSGFGTTNINAVTYGNGLFVAVGNAGTLTTSTDGVAWTSRTSGFGTTGIRSVAFGNGLFVAVGNNGTMTTSSDGITWTSRTSGFGTTIIRSVAFGNGLFVAVGDSGTMTTSSDGITWTSRTSGFGTTTIQAVTYGNGLFVAVGDSGTLTTSSDGVTWTSRTSGFGTSAITGVTFGGSLYITVGVSGLIFTSTDAITWTSRTSGTTTSFTSITYGNGVYVAVGNSALMRTSTDGITWTSQTSGFGASTITNIGFGNNTFVAVGTSGTLTTNNPSYIYLAIA